MHVEVGQRVVWRPRVHHGGVQKARLEVNHQQNGQDGERVAAARIVGHHRVVEECDVDEQESDVGELEHPMVVGLEGVQ